MADNKPYEHTSAGRGPSAVGISTYRGQVAGRDAEIVTVQSSDGKTDVETLTVKSKVEIDHGKLKSFNGMERAQAEALVEEAHTSLRAPGAEHEHTSAGRGPSAVGINTYKGQVAGRDAEMVAVHSSDGKTDEETLTVKSTIVMDHGKLKSFNGMEKAKAEELVAQARAALGVSGATMSGVSEVDHTNVTAPKNIPHHKDTSSKGR